MKPITFVLLLTGFYAQSQVNLASGLKVCYPFNGNTQDASGNNNHGQLSGQISLTTDRFNNQNSAYHFSGGFNDFIAISSLTNIVTNDAISVSLWAQSDLQTSTCLIQLQPDNANDRCVMCAQYSGVGLIWDYGSIYTNGRITQNTLYDQNWHHYVFVLSADPGFKGIYMDGVLVASATTFGTLQNKNLPVYLGGGTSSVGGGSLRWRGKIDDVYMYNRLLNQSEVTSLFNNQSPCALETVGLMENSSRLSESLNLYPNPVRDGMINLDLGVQPELLEIIDVCGKTVMTWNKDQLDLKNTLTIDRLSPGYYTVRCKAGDQFKTTKLFVQH